MKVIKLAIFLADVLNQIFLMNQRIAKVENQMSDLSNAVQRDADAEAKLETRVTAHEQNLKDIGVQLQTVIDGMKAGQLDAAAATTALVALGDKIDAFDPDAVPDPPVA